MAYTIGTEKTMGDMFNDLDTLLLNNGWDKVDQGRVSTITTSRGYTYSGEAIAVEGKFPGTSGFKLNTELGLYHTTYNSETEPSDSFFTDYPSDWSVSLWFKVDKQGSWRRLSSSRDGSRYSGIHPTFVRGFHTDTYTQFSISSMREGGIGSMGHNYVPYNYLVEEDIIDYTGSRWELLTITHDSDTGENKVYINGNLYATADYSNYEVKPAVYSFYRSIDDLNISDFVVWDKTLTPTDVSNLYNSTTPVLSSDANVFEHFTENITVNGGGVYKYTDQYGVNTFAIIDYNKDTNNIALSTAEFYADLTFSLHHTVQNLGYRESSIKYLAGVPSGSLTTRKYWLVVKDNTIIIGYKLYDPNSSRLNAVYQVGYIGGYTEFGYMGNSSIVLGMTSTSNYNWETTDNTNFKCGCTNTANASFRVFSSSSVTPTVDNAVVNIPNLSNFEDYVFLSDFYVGYSSSLCGSLKNLYNTNISVASPEDIITINSVDYVILGNGDDSNSLLAIKLD